MKPVLFLFVVAIAVSFSYTLPPEKEITRKPAVYINNFSVPVKEGEVLHCSKMQDLGVVVYFTPEMSAYDNVKIELHRFNAKEDEMIAFKKIEPNSEEYRKSYANKDSLKFKVICPETETQTSDFVINTKKFVVSTFINDVFCTFKARSLNDFYLIIIGNKKTEEKTRFGEDVFVPTTLSPKSVIFKNWSDAHH